MPTSLAGVRKGKRTDKEKVEIAKDKEKIETAIQFAEKQIARLLSPSEQAKAKVWKRLIRILR